MAEMAAIDEHQRRRHRHLLEDGRPEKQPATENDPGLVARGTVGIWDREIHRSMRRDMHDGP